MLKWRILLIAVLACTTMPESMRLAAYCCQFGLAPANRERDKSAPCPDLPAPCDSEEGKWVTADTVDDHDGSFFSIVDFQPLWRPALSAGGRGFYATSRE